MNARPLRWWPEAVLDATAATITPAWQGWCTDWGVSAPAVRASNASDSIATAGGHWHWHQAARQGEATVWLGITHTEGVEAMRELLFMQRPAPSESRVDDSSSIAAEVAGVGWRELRERLTSSLAAIGLSTTFDDSDTQAAAPAKADWRRWSGAIDVVLDAGRAEAEPILMHLSGPAAEAMAKKLPASPAKRASAREPMITRSAAIERQEIRLAAELDGVALRLDVFESLRLGDVLPLQHRLDEPLHIRLPGDGADRASSAVFCAALLGARRGRRAVELVRTTAHA
jgi:hypothetical protein